jgi:hypothetical protein
MEYHLIKRNPEISGEKRGNLCEGMFWFVQTRASAGTSGAPAGSAVEIGDIVYAYETGYAVWAQGKVLKVSKGMKFTEIEEILDYATNKTNYKNNSYWGPEILKKVYPNYKKKDFSYQVLEVYVDLKLLKTPVPLDKKYDSQNAWRYLKNTPIEEIEVSLELKPEIPSFLRFKLYHELNLTGKEHYLDIDHFVPLSLGGPGNIEENLVPVGLSLNRYKSNRVPAGLFVVAKSIGKYDGKIDSEDPSHFFSEDEYKKKARLIIQKINKIDDNWSLNEAKNFYAAVKKYHNPNL